MTPQYKIIVDPALNLMRIWIAGFFKPDDVARFVADRNAAYKQLRCRPNEHLTLVDIREIAIQPQDAVAAFEKALHTPGIYSRRIAIVTRTSLSRSQVKRAAHGRDIAYFDDIDAAEAWVLGASAQAA